MQWPPTVPPKFPLTVTSRGYVKHIGGRTRWIAGRVAPDEALKLYHAKAKALIEGRKMRKAPAQVRATTAVNSILNRFLIEKRAAQARGEITFGHYTEIGRLLGLAAKEMGGLLVGNLSPTALADVAAGLRRSTTPGNAARACKLLVECFTHAYDEAWIDQPVRIGKAFRVAARVSKDPKPWQMFRVEDVRAILAASGERIGRLLAQGERDVSRAVQLHAMILLALNGGFSPTELAELRRDQVFLDAAEIRSVRGKTTEAHVVPLWHQTVTALRDVYALPGRDGADLVFLTRQGQPWVRRAVGKKNADKSTSINGIGDAFNDLLAEMSFKRAKGVSFYKLKHFHATIADEFGDVPATYALAGHKRPDVKVYYARVSAERVRKLVAFIQHHVFPVTSAETQTADPARPASPPAA